MAALPRSTHEIWLAPGGHTPVHVPRNRSNGMRPARRPHQRRTATAAGAGASGGRPRAASAPASASADARMSRLINQVPTECTECGLHRRCSRSDGRCLQCSARPSPTPAPTPPPPTPRRLPADHPLRRPPDVPECAVCYTPMHLCPRAAPAGGGGGGAGRFPCHSHVLCDACAVQCTRCPYCRAAPTGGSSAAANARASGYTADMDDIYGTVDDIYGSV